ncbi:MAG: DUF488 family protein [Candidatus Margulisiibacteriota bacterium]
MSNEVKIYTLGTSNRSIEEFLEILKNYQIQTVIDVRRWPTSKWFEHFKKENLEKILKENNIEYHHFEKLGGYRTGGYEEYTKTKEFKEVLKELIEISKFQNVVLICAERLPWKCHRAFIARELEKKKIEIIHILEKGRIWQPRTEIKEIKPLCQKFRQKEEDLK